MEEYVPCKPYVTSTIFLNSRSQVYSYGVYTFGLLQAERYNQQIERAVETLSQFYTYYPECRHLATKSRMYRNIILDAHLIIYRIKPTIAGIKAGRDELYEKAVELILK